MTDPSLEGEERQRLVADLMDARRRVGTTKRGGDSDGEAAARRAVDVAKRALGERGPVWWTDGAPDLNRRMVTSTLYASWYAGLETAHADADVRADDASAIARGLTRPTS